MAKDTGKVTKGKIGENEQLVRRLAKRLNWDLNSAMFKAELQEARRLDNPDVGKVEEEPSPTENLKVKRDGNLVTITVDLTKSYGKSKSGKSEIVASTLGTVSVGEVSFNINAWK